jgi:hypothetical protein
MKPNPPFPYPATHLTNYPIPYPWFYTATACPCCGHSVFDLRLYYGLRTLYGTSSHAFQLTSLARCAKHNFNVGGAPESRHIYGLAADLKPTTITLHELAGFALLVPIFRDGGFGYYPSQGIIHLDVRPRPARWVKDSQGFHPCPDLWPASTTQKDDATCQPTRQPPQDESPPPPQQLPLE